MGESGTEESEEWTKADLQKLLAAMKTSIPEHDRTKTYIRGLKAVDWDVVAFPPFSPEACQEKWRQILQKMCKTRTLTELIVEAECVISNPLRNIKIHPECPKRPSPPNAVFVAENAANYQKKHAKMGHQKKLKNLVKAYQTLPDEEKARYVEKFQLANEEYARRMQVFRKEFIKSTRPERRAYRKKLSANTKAQVTEDTEGMPPKPPVNGYNLFCKEQSTSRKIPGGNNCVTVWAQSWRDMTEKEKDKYKTRSTELKRQYAVELNEYLMNLDEEKQQRVLKEKGIKRPKVSKDIKKKDRKKIPGEPKMTARSGCGIFCKKQMVLMKKKCPNSRDRFVMANKMWQDLPTVEKKRYKAEVFEDNKKYSLELQKWFETLSAAQQQFYRIHNPSKLQYLRVDQLEDYDFEEPCGYVYRPSDSEDEDTEDSSDEEENHLDEVYEEDDDDVIVFELY